MASGEYNNSIIQHSQTIVSIGVKLYMHFFHSTMVKLRSEVVDQKMTEESSFSQETPKEQEVSKQQPSTDEAPSDGTAAPSQGKSHKHGL